MTNLTTKPMENPYPPGKTDSQLTNDFADFFKSKILGIRERFKDIQPYQLSVKDVPKLSRFTPVMESKVELIVKSMKSKTCELDHMPTTLLKDLLQVVFPTITRIVNLSLSKGQFHTSWKMAIVHPLLKKLGLELINPNYRPLTNIVYI